MTADAPKVILQQRLKYGEGDSEIKLKKNYPKRILGKDAIVFQPGAMDFEYRFKKKRERNQ